MFCRIIRDGQILSGMNVPRQDVIDRTDLLHIFVHAVVIVCDIFICDIPEGISLLDLDACVIFIRRFCRSRLCVIVPSRTEPITMTVKTINPNMNVRLCAFTAALLLLIRIPPVMLIERSFRTFVTNICLCSYHNTRTSVCQQENRTNFRNICLHFYACCVKLNYT